MGIPVRQRWEESATIAPDVDYFAADITARSNKAVKHTIQIFMPTTGGVVNLQVIFATFLKVLELNEGVALVANAAYQFDFIVYPGMSYNIQHKTATVNVACSISESENTDI